MGSIDPISTTYNKNFNTAILIEDNGQQKEKKIDKM
jgi:hypothetical protein